MRLHAGTRIRLGLVLLIGAIWISLASNASAGGLDFVSSLPWGDDLRMALGPVTRVTISPQTTVIDGPLADDGYVDYLAALNDLARRDIASADNAAVLFWQAIGRDAVWAGNREAFRRSDDFQKMGVVSLPESPKCFVEHWDFIKALPADRKLELFGAKDGTALSQADRRFERARSRPWKRDEFPEIAEWLRRNEAPLQTFVDGTRRGKYYSAIGYSTTEMRYRTADTIRDLTYFEDPLVSSLVDVVRAMNARGMLRLGNRQTDEAWEDLMACLRCARTVSCGPLRLHLEFAQVIETRVLKTAVSFAQCGKLSRDQISGCRADLNRLPPRDSIAKKIDVAERFACLDMISSVPRYRRSFFETIWSGAPRFHPTTVMGSMAVFSVNWDDVLRYVNHWYDQSVDVASQPTRALQDEALDQLVEQHVNPIVSTFPHRNRKRRPRQVRFFVERPLAAYAVTAPLALRVMTTHSTREMYLVVLMPHHAVSWSFRYEDEATAWMALLEAVFALKMFHTQKGEYPRDLSELVPDYLAEIPQDPFSRQPLRYRPESDGYVLYSVGRNKEDDGGTVDTEDDWEGDLVVSWPIRDEVEDDE